jgi:hypothetical protein
MMGGGDFSRQRRAHLRAAWCAVLGALGTALATGWVARPAKAQSDDRMTKARAEYQDMPNGIYSCAICTLFVPPGTCKVVQGEVSPNGWCKAFALAD